MQLGFVCLENTDSVPEAIVDRQFIRRLARAKRRVVPRDRPSSRLIARMLVPSASTGRDPAPEWVSAATTAASGRSCGSGAMIAAGRAARWRATAPSTAPPRCARCATERRLAARPVLRRRAFCVSADAVTIEDLNARMDPQPGRRSVAVPSSNTSIGRSVCMAVRSRPITVPATEDKVVHAQHPRNRVSTLPRRGVHPRLSHDLRRDGHRCHRVGRPTQSRTAECGPINDGDVTFCELETVEPCCRRREQTAGLTPASLSVPEFGTGHRLVVQTLGSTGDGVNGG
ncbi:hypothetical protein TSHO111613_15875 [Tsukamurella hominis]